MVLYWITHLCRFTDLVLLYITAHLLASQNIQNKAACYKYAFTPQNISVSLFLSASIRGCIRSSCHQRRSIVWQELLCHLHRAATRYSTACVRNTDTNMRSWPIFRRPTRIYGLHLSADVSFSRRLQIPFSLQVIFRWWTHRPARLWQKALLHCSDDSLQFLHASRITEEIPSDKPHIHVSNRLLIC